MVEHVRSRQAHTIFRSVAAGRTRLRKTRLVQPKRLVLRARHRLERDRGAVSSVDHHNHVGEIDQLIIREMRARFGVDVVRKPDPLMGSVDPDEPIDDDIPVTLMLAMERLSPLERAAFLLHNVFAVALSDVAVTLGREPAAVRQLASRARKHVQAARPRFSVEAAEASRITQAFFVAVRDGDTASLASLRAQEVEIHSDGGGKVLAFRNVIRGLDRALRLFAGLRRKNAPTAQLLRTVEIDGLPGYISVDRDLVQTTELDIRDGKITAI